MSLFQTYSLRTLIFQKSRQVIIIIYNMPLQGYSIIEAHESQRSQQFQLFSQLQTERKYRPEKNIQKRLPCSSLFSSLCVFYGALSRGLRYTGSSSLAVSCFSFIPHSCHQCGLLVSLKWLVKPASFLR